MELAPFLQLLESRGPGALGWLLFAGCALAIIRGKLVPGSERDYWREAFFVQQKRGDQVEVIGRLWTKLLGEEMPPGLLPDDHRTPGADG